MENINNKLTMNDKLEMQELMGRYIFASDVDGPEAMRDIFVEDSRLVIEAMQVDVQGIDNIIKWFDEILKHITPRVYHSVSSFVIDGEGNEATLNCVSQAVQPIEGEMKFFSLGHYQDKFVKTANGWRVKEHRIVVLS